MTTWLKLVGEAVVKKKEINLVSKSFYNYTTATTMETNVGDLKHSGNIFT